MQDCQTPVACRARANLSSKPTGPHPQSVDYPRFSGRRIKFQPRQELGEKRFSLNDLPANVLGWRKANRAAMTMKLAETLG
jgi:hypothetical protein